MLQGHAQCAIRCFAFECTRALGTLAAQTAVQQVLPQTHSMHHGIAYGAGKYQRSVFTFTFATLEKGASIGRHISLRYKQSRSYRLEPNTPTRLQEVSAECMPVLSNHQPASDNACCMMRPCVFANRCDRNTINVHAYMCVAIPCFISTTCHGVCCVTNGVVQDANRTQRGSSFM